MWKLCSWKRWYRGENTLVLSSPSFMHYITILTSYCDLGPTLAAMCALRAERTSQSKQHMARGWIEALRQGGNCSCKCPPWLHVGWCRYAIWVPLPLQTCEAGFTDNAHATGASCNISCEVWCAYRIHFWTLQSTSMVFWFTTFWWIKASLFDDTQSNYKWRLHSELIIQQTKPSICFDYIFALLAFWLSWN